VLSSCFVAAENAFQCAEALGFEGEVVEMFTVTEAWERAGEKKREVLRRKIKMGCEGFMSSALGTQD
jgi:hypothetical protein